MADNEEFKEWLNEYLESEPNETYARMLETLLESETQKRKKAEKEAKRLMRENNVLKRKMTERVSHTDADCQRLRSSNQTLIEDKKRLQSLVKSLQADVDRLKKERIYRRKDIR